MNGSMAYCYLMHLKITSSLKAIIIPHRLSIHIGNNWNEQIQK